MKIATFYPTPYGSLDAAHAYSTALYEIESGLNVRTTQMCLLNDVKDYDVIRIVSNPTDVVEIINNHDKTYECDRTKKELRVGHNFFKLWENGVFDL